MSEYGETLIDNLNSINNSKVNIKQALINKGQSPTDVFNTYANLIEGIPSINTSDANATVNDIMANKTAYVNGTKIVGTIQNIGTLNITPLENVQNIPSGYTTGGAVQAVNITSLNTYKSCMNISKQILNYPNLRELEYVLCPGNYFLDTGVPIGYDNIRIETGMVGISSAVSGNPMMLYGSPSSSGGGTPGRGDLAILTQTNTFGIFAGATGYPFNVSYAPYVDNLRYDIIGEFSSNAYNMSFKASGVETPFVANGTMVNYASNSNMWLFASMAGGTPFYYAGGLYYFRLFINNTLVRDYMPVLNATNYVFLFDKVTRTFQTGTSTNGASYLISGPIKEDS